MYYLGKRRMPGWRVDVPAEEIGTPPRGSGSKINSKPFESPARFIQVGRHILPESNEQFEKRYEEEMRALDEEGE